MYKKLTRVKNIAGIHTRPASAFARCASKFKSHINVKRVGSDEEVNAKSIITLLAATMSLGDELEISARGEDEREAVEALVALIDSKFGEQ